MIYVEKGTFLNRAYIEVKMTYIEVTKIKQFMKENGFDLFFS